ncbi:MAG: flavodoxin domain-containing protein [Spirochaetales bacterium]
MSCAVIYTSKYGATREVAERIVAGLKSGQVDAEAVEAAPKRPLPDAETIVVGAPIYAGSAPGRMTNYLEAQREKLLAKRVFIFLSCLYEGSRAEQQLADAFPSWLVAHSSGNFYVGGKVDFSKLGFLDRLIMKKVAGVSEDVEKLKPEEIDRLVETVRRG